MHLMIDIDVFCYFSFTYISNVFTKNRFVLARGWLIT